MEFIIFTKQSTGNSFDLKKNRFFAVNSGTI